MWFWSTPSPSDRLPKLPAAARSADAFFGLLSLLLLLLLPRTPLMLLLLLPLVLRRPALLLALLAGPCWLSAREAPAVLSVSMM
jgi:hypothetical protein